ncbi:Seipin [Dactylella cylindrospora]|nr:Seipin [Dactylella cylindrospora]
MLLIPTIISGPLGTVYSNVTSRTAQKAYIQTILATILSLILLGLACLGYILFYLNYIPQIGLETTVHLVYGTYRFVPYGAANISYNVLMHNQPYDIYVSLRMPTSRRNFEAGNFMINLTLFDEGLEAPVALASSRRPACLTYKSNLIQTMDTVMRSPLYLSGWTREEETLNILMMESEVFGKNRLPKYLGIRVGNDYSFEKAPEAYESKVYFKAKFKGLRYFMYNYRIIAFITFTGMFWMTELFWASIAWMIISSYLAPEEDDDQLTELRPADKSATSSETERRRVHPLAPAEDDSEEIPRPRGVYATPEATPAPEGEEGDDEGDSEDFSNDKSDEGGRTPTSTDENPMQGSAQDSGIGTSMSENRAGGLVRRRSGRRND